MNDPRKGVPSASQFSRLALCPGSFLLEKQCPDVVNDAAEEGTLLHGYMERMLKGDSCDDLQLSPEQVELCGRAFKLLDGAMDSIKQIHEGAVFELISVEERVFLSDWLEGGEYSGQWDALYKVTSGDGCVYLFVLDWKFGRVEVDSAEANYQIRAIVPLVDSKAEEEGIVHDGIYAAIIQPRVAGGASLVSYYADDIEAAREDSLGVARLALSPDAPRCCSEAACRYCKAKAVCREATVAVESASLITTDRDKWELFSPEEKVQAYRLAKMAGKWKAAVECRFEQDVVAGLIPGFEMGAGRTSFTVTDPAAAFSFLNAEFPDVITGEAFTRCCKVGITELDKLFHEACKATDPKATMKGSREYLRQILAEYGESKTTKGSVKEIGGGEE